MKKMMQKKLKKLKKLKMLTLIKKKLKPKNDMMISSNNLEKI
jgi:hypothetical protein